VLLQTALLLGVVVAGLLGGPWPPSLRVPALVIAIIPGAAGLWLAASAIAALGKSGSPFPKPPAVSELKESGPYALVRHPFYGRDPAAVGDVVADTQSLGARPDRRARHRPGAQGTA
jgi:protein-S-isoprenylcysteine O-methyltransferase Ste14